MTTPFSPSLSGSLVCILSAHNLSILKLPIKLTLSTFSNNPKSCIPLLDTTFAPTAIPAQFTKQFIPLKPSIAFFISSSLETSPTTYLQFMSSATFFSPSAFKSISSTSAPLFFRYLAVPSPRPLPAPVITALTFSIFIFYSPKSRISSITLPSFGKLFMGTILALPLKFITFFISSDIFCCKDSI